MTLPIYEQRIQEENGKRHIWCQLRKKFMVWTPEEFVRQNLISFLKTELGVPPALMSIERGVRINHVAKRYDLVVFDRNAAPLIALECKAPTIDLDKKSVFQLAVYNSKLSAPFMLLTNGKELFFYQRDQAGEFVPVESIPEFEEMLESGG